MVRVLTAELARETSADLAANEAALRLLCVRAELLTDTASPPQDDGVRRNWLMQQLVKGLGQARPTPQEAFEGLVHEWLAVGVTADGAHAELRERFLRCRQRALAGK
jgi:hypothetical protein